MVENAIPATNVGAQTPVPAVIRRNYAQDSKIKAVPANGERRDPEG